jgi:RHS repeat-associated protein
MLHAGKDSAGSASDRLSRIASILDDDGTTRLCDDSYLGRQTFVEQDDTQPDIKWTLVSLSGSNDPDTGDIYTGLDRFGRIKDLRWRDVSANTDLSRIRYGYDRASNRTWRSNPVATASSAQYDWLYGYDGLQRLKNGGRGLLNTAGSSLTSTAFSQCWTLDETGNWSGFKQSDNGATWSLQQTRTANPVNELTTINATVGEQWADPTYDANGNMTSIPRPGLPRPSWANLTTDQWSTLTVDQWVELEVAPKFKATYDAWNRLVTLADGGNGAPVQESHYDGRGCRIVTKTYTAGSLTETRHAYFTDRWQIVEERLGSSTTPDRQVVWGVRYIDDLILRDRSVTGTLNERLYGCQDANWNMTAVTDSTGTVQERYEYDPYGVTIVLAPNFTVRTTSTFAWETTYCSYRWDLSIGLFAVRHRFYHPQLGVWITRDPQPQPPTSLYCHLSSEPIGNTDPYGLQEMSMALYDGPFPHPLPDPNEVGPVDGLAEQIIATCCNGLAGLPRLICEAESHWLEEALERARKKINKSGGAVRWSDWGGNNCTDCCLVAMNEVPSALPTAGGPLFCRTRAVQQVPLIDTPLWAGHEWLEVTCPQSGEIAATVDFWLVRGDAWRPGKDGFGWSPNSRR